MVPPLPVSLDNLVANELEFGTIISEFYVKRVPFVPYMVLIGSVRSLRFVFLDLPMSTLLWLGETTVDSERVRSLSESSMYSPHH